jgi:hypothetical protein
MAMGHVGQRHCGIWIVGSLLLSWYVANFGSYNATYGSLGAIIGLLVWMWLSTIIVLAGAEINAETEHQTARDSTEGGGKWPTRLAQPARDNLLNEETSAAFCQHTPNPGFSHGTEHTRTVRHDV